MKACFDFELEWLRGMALPMNRNKNLIAGLVKEDNELGFGYLKLELPLEHDGNVQKVV